MISIELVKPGVAWVDDLKLAMVSLPDGPVLEATDHPPRGRFVGPGR